MNLLTVDVEDWTRSSLELLSRVEADRARACLPQVDQQVTRGVRRILTWLARADARATFFVLGETARAQPDLVREIHSAGHEVASHGQSHTPLPGMSEATLRRELATSKQILEDTINSAVVGFRAPYLRPYPDRSAFHAALASAGYVYDSSQAVCADKDESESRIESVGRTGMAEVPVTSRRFLLKRVPLGGTYLRWLGPRQVSRHVAQLNAHHRPVVLYIHPYEADTEPVAWPHPTPSRAARISLMLRNFGKPRYERLITHLLARHDFTTILNHLGKGGQVS